MFNLLTENWVTIVMLVLMGIGLFVFFSKPSAEQRDKVKEWLLWAVTTAEAELGDGTGQLKLRQVYDMFIVRFPAVAKVISFDTFMLWVDEALEEMREMLKNNKAVSKLVKGETENE